MFEHFVRVPVTIIMIAADSDLSGFPRFFLFLKGFEDVRSDYLKWGLKTIVNILTNLKYYFLLILLVYCATNNFCFLSLK